jgi:hypothetical protein
MSARQAAATAIAMTLAVFMMTPIPEDSFKSSIGRARADGKAPRAELSPVLKSS